MGAGVDNAHHMLSAACDPMVGCFPGMLPTLHCSSDTIAARTLKVLHGITHLGLSSQFSGIPQNLFLGDICPCTGLQLPCA